MDLSTATSIVTFDDTTIMVEGKRKKVQETVALAEIEYSEFKDQTLEIGRMLADTKEVLEKAVNYFEETKNLNVKKKWGFSFRKQKSQWTPFVAK